MFSPENHGIPQENMYKLVDMKGRLMAVKPDLTMPIARLACTRLPGSSAAASAVL